MRIDDLGQKNDGLDHGLTKENFASVFAVQE
jgi:hypothetical protein